MTPNLVSLPYSPSAKTSTPAPAVSAWQPGFDGYRLNELSPLVPPILNRRANKRICRVSRHSDPLARQWSNKRSKAPINSAHQTPSRRTKTKPGRPAGLGSIFHRGVFYASCHEAACGELMERFIPGYRVIQGQTFQIQIRQPFSDIVRSVDFMVHGYLFEYHPPRFRSDRRRYGDFGNLDDYLCYVRTLRSGLSKQEKEKFIAETRRELARRYAQKRREIIDQDPRFAGTPLITASCPAEFYDRVIAHFGRHYPPKQKFLNMFYAIVHAAFEKNKFLYQRKRGTKRLWDGEGRRKVA